MTTFADDLKNKQNDVRPFNEHDAMVQSVRHISRAVMISLGILFAGLTTCGIVSELTDEADGRGEGSSYAGQAKLAEAQGKKALAEVELTKAQNVSIVELIQSGTDPIAARCAIIGWTVTDDVCAALADKQPLSSIESITEPNIESNIESDDGPEAITFKDLNP